MSRYIDADALAEYEENAWDWETVDYIQTTTAINQIISDIRNESTADVRENVHGEWIKYGDKYKCSKCFATMSVNPINPKLKDRFCYYCGADMSGGESV